MMLKRFDAVRAIVAIFAAIVLFWATACRPARKDDLFLARGEVMGTYYVLKVPAAASSDAESVEAAVKNAVEALRSVDASMSTYKEDSELSRLNQWPANEPFHLSDGLMTVLALSLDVSAASGGAFDVTVGPIVNAYGFGPQAAEGRHFPSEEELANLRQRVGSGLLRLNRATSDVVKARADVYCDLSAVAKGYGVDRAAEALEAGGIDRYIVEVGGEVRARGLNAKGRPWRIGIEKPLETGQGVQQVIELTHHAVATSGDYRNFVFQEGRRISHTIDPRTGRPINHHLASVTVVHERCAEADALATTLMVMGPDEGMAWAREKELAVLFLVRQSDGSFKTESTPAFDRLAD